MSDVVYVSLGHLILQSFVIHESIVMYAYVV